MLYDLALDVVFDSSDAQKIVAQPRYATNESDSRDPLSFLVTDFWFRCASRQWAVHNSAPSFVYEYLHVFSGMQEVISSFGLPQMCADRCCHATELPFTFDNDAPQSNVTFQPDEAVLANAMQSYWASFVINQDPNVARSPGTIEWPVFTNTSRQHIALQAPTDFSVANFDELCALWDEIWYIK